MSKRRVPMNVSRRAVLTGLAYHWAKRAAGATVAEVAEAVVRNVRRVSLSESRCYGILLELASLGYVVRREGQHGSWRPTLQGMLHAAGYVTDGSVRVRDDVRDAITRVAAFTESELDVRAQAGQAAASLLADP